MQISLDDNVNGRTTASCWKKKEDLHAYAEAVEDRNGNDLQMMSICLLSWAWPSLAQIDCRELNKHISGKISHSALPFQ